MLDSALDGSDPFDGTKYRSIAILGKGGMGAAHVVEHRRLGTRFVCKILRGRHRNNAALADRMRVEAQSLARLTHPNIVRVFDFDLTPEGRPFIVMEHLLGNTLTRELRERGELPCVEAIHWTTQLLSALSAAHLLGIVHRDVKLDNLFLHRLDGGQRILKVLDFGIAKIQAGFAAAGLEPPHVPTCAGAIVGTPRFLSPEAAKGCSVDHRADIYSAGVVLYMFLCGRGPWDEASSHVSVFTAQTSRVPPPPSKFATQPILDRLDAAVMSALAIDPEERFQTAKAFENALASTAAVLEPSTFVSVPEKNAARLDLSTRSATFRFSDGKETRTSAPIATSLEGGAGHRRWVQGSLAFVVSAAATATITWWFLSWAVPP